MPSIFHGKPMLAAHARVHSPALNSLAHAARCDHAFSSTLPRVAAGFTSLRELVSNTSSSASDRIRQFARVLSLRIDVQLPSSELERELDAIDRRLQRPGDALYDLPSIDITLPGFVFRYREADGEHYIYVEDTARGCLAGYTVFNRLIEVNRRQDKYLRATHSKYAPAYQRRGIATAIYRWWLDAGHCLITGARQSAGANALWHSLSDRYALIYVDLRHKTLRYLGHQVDDAIREDLHTRMILLGKNWELARLADVMEMQMPGETGNTVRRLPAS